MYRNVFDIGLAHAFVASVNFPTPAAAREWRKSISAAILSKPIGVIRVKEAIGG